MYIIYPIAFHIPSKRRYNWSLLAPEVCFFLLTFSEGASGSIYGHIVSGYVPGPTGVGWLTPLTFKENRHPNLGVLLWGET